LHVAVHHFDGHRECFDQRAAFQLPVVDSMAKGIEARIVNSGLQMRLAALYAPHDAAAVKAARRKAASRDCRV